MRLVRVAARIAIVFHASVGMGQDQPHVIVRLDAVTWGPASPKLPPGACFARVSGDPSKAGEPYVFRARLPDGYSVPPHWHPQDEHVTVLQGVMRIGFGSVRHDAAMHDLPAGSYALLSKHLPHYNAMKGETILQFHGVGPYDIIYVNAGDAPKDGPAAFEPNPTCGAEGGAVLSPGRVRHGERRSAPPNGSVKKALAMTTDAGAAGSGPRGDAARDAPLAIDGATFRKLGHRLVDQLAEFLESVPQRRVTPGEPPSLVREALDLSGPLPETGTDPEQLLERTAQLLFDHSLFNGHPRFFGFITAAPAPIGILGDFLAAAVNPNVGAWVLAPAATEIEAQTVRWIAELVGYPAECGGLLVSGGNMANLVCLLAARTSQAGWNVREQGLAGAAQRLRVYASLETHTWIEKAADIAGLGTTSIRWIPTDAQLRMDVAALRHRIEADIAAGDAPCLVVGTAGSISTGAVDPLRAVGAVCREHGVWFHVDGAYGGFAAAVPGAPDDLRELSQADSVAVDPHKWLYAPLEAGCALVRDPERLRAAFAYHPSYYHFNERATNYLDYGVQNSRGFRALKVWLALRQVGAAAYRRMIADDIHLSRRLADAIGRCEALQLVTQELSITTFRYVPPDLRPNLGGAAVEAHLDAINRILLERLQRGGEAFVSNAVVGGRFVLRACIVNFRTTAADADAVPAIVTRIGREVDAELRPGV